MYRLLEDVPDLAHTSLYRADLGFDRTEITFVYNGRFGHLSDGRRLRMHEHFDNGGSVPGSLLLFGKRSTVLWFLEQGQWKLFSEVFGYMDVLKEDRRYYSVFGSFVNKSVVLASTRRNFDGALTRLFKSRLGDNDQSIERVYRRFQENIFSTNTSLGRYLDRAFRVLRSKMSYALASLEDVMAEREAYVNLPHIKRKLRIAELRRMSEEGLLDSIFTIQSHSMLKRERCKAGKVGRAYVSLGPESPIGFGYGINRAKSAWSDIWFDGGWFCFCQSTEPDEMNRILRKAASTRFSYVFFSDDGILWCDNECYEIDISSCDSATYTPVFERMAWLFVGSPMHEKLIRDCIAQCKSPIKFRDPQGTFAFSMKGVEPIEKSGVCITTLLNNVSSFSIMASIHKHRCTDEESIVNAAALVGHKITCKKITTLARARFLACFMYYDDHGVLQTALGPEVILRGFGSCYMDLPGSVKMYGKWRERAHLWMSAVLSSFVHSGLGLFLCGLNRSFHRKHTRFKALVDDDVLKHQTIGARPDVPLEILAQRYELPLPYLDHFIQLTHHLQPGFILRHPVVDRMLSVGYGY